MRSLPGGGVYLRTDDADYFAQMTGVFGASKEFQRMETPPELAELLTDFEREFRARGISTLRAAYRTRALNFKRQSPDRCRRRILGGRRTALDVTRLAAAGQNVQRDGHDADDE